MSDLYARLLALAQSSEVPSKTQTHARALHYRLRKPLNVLIGGPDAALARELAQAVPSDQTAFNLTDGSTDADIVVWCTHDFRADEVAIWQDAPAHLQHHSHLVSRSNTDIQQLGGPYFRNCWMLNAPTDAGDVVAAVMRQIRLGQEAGHDQAQALLARYPTIKAVAEPQVVTAPIQPPGDPIVAYLQAQAGDLAALDITQTPESCAAVLARCAETAEHLSTLVVDLPNAALQEAVFDACDAITLMVIEADLAAATDAVTVLLQLQKEFKTEACLAV